MPIQLPTWLYPPVLADQTQTQIARILYYIQIILFVTLGPMVGIALGAGLPLTASMLGLCGVATLVSVGLMRRGWLLGSALLLSIAWLLAIHYFLWTGNEGLHNIALLAYPVFIMIASLTLSRGWLTILMALGLGSLGGLTYAYLMGWLGPHSVLFLPYRILADYLFVAVLFVAMGVGVRVLTETLLAGLSRARENAQALQDSNQQLQARTVELEAERDLAARRRQQVEQVIHLGKLVTQSTTVYECFLVAHRCIHQELGFDRVGLFLFHPATDTIQGMVGTDRQGQPEDTRWYVQAIMGRAWHYVFTNPDGVQLLEDYQATHQPPPGDEMYGVRQHLTLAAWAGDKPMALITVDNIITQRIIPPEAVETLRLFAGYMGLAVRNALMHEDLEHRVEQRTAELQAANHELESFAYSISHDLRAPLRSIDGFTRILQDDDQWGVEAHHYLERTRAAAHRMNQLIDGVLEFSRLGRQALKVKQLLPLEMLVLVQGVIDDLSANGGERQIEWRVSELAPGVADPLLLRQVWANLLGNAVKYTRYCSPAIIEVGMAADAYCVRDNGVGFDGRYADKLFNVFQRLHHGDEFEGTGVGLANVKRIIERHGGRVWAEGAVDRGATFYFTL